MKQKMIILIGPPNAGKSTLAKEILESYKLFNERKVTVVSKDRIREMLRLSNVDGKIENLVHDVHTNLLHTIKTDVILDNTNCRISDVKKTIDEYRGKYEFEIRLIDVTSMDELASRNRSRASHLQVPIDAIASMYQSYLHTRENLESLELYAKKASEAPVVNTASGYNSYERDFDKKKAVVIDIDGTVAHRNGRGPFDWSKVGEDLPDYNVIELVQTLYSHGYDLIFVSGRDSVCRQETVDWISDKMELYDYVLHMRKEGDFRKDQVIKKEIYDAYIKPQYDVRFVLDDRNKVVHFWRSIGLKCLQVEEGDF